MTEAHDNPAFQRRSQVFKVLTTVIMAGLALVLTVFALTLLLSPKMTHDLAIRITVPWLPAIFYIWILVILRGLFGDLATGGLSFRPNLAGAMAKIGWALMLGAVTTLLVNPLLTLLLPPHRIGGLMIFDLPALALVMVGFALVMLARMLQRAVALEAETRDLREELDTFL